MIDAVRWTVRVLLILLIVAANPYSPPAAGQPTCARKDDLLLKFWEGTAALAHVNLQSTSDYRKTLTGWHLEGQTFYDYNESGRTAVWTDRFNGAEVVPWSVRKFALEGTNYVDVREEVYDDPHWLPSSRVLIDHDFSGSPLLVRTLYQRWNGSEWVDGERTTYAYDASHVRSGGQTDAWDGVAWTPVHRFTIEQVGDDVSVIDDAWRGDRWVPALRTTFRGSTIPQLMARITELRNALDDFGETIRCALLLSAAEYEAWDGADWLLVVRDRLEYDEGTDRVAGAISENWTDGAWTPTGRLSMTYDDEDGRLASIDEESFIDGSWSTRRHESYVYDDQGSVRTVTQQSSDEFGQDEIQRRIVMEWIYDDTASESVDPFGAPSGFALAAPYPNPLRAETRLEFHIPTAGPVHVHVHDLLGRVVATLVEGIQPAGTHVATFDARSLPSGQYIATLKASGFVQSRMISLVR